MAVIAVVSSPHALLPEVEAYRRFISGTTGHEVVVCDRADTRSQRFDVVIGFLGFWPRWQRPVACKYFIADLNSRSVGRMRMLKDVTKSLLNLQPDAVVALNEYVAAIPFGPTAPINLTRGMGYFDEFVLPRATAEYDVVYSGTLARPGLREAIGRLGALGLRVAVAGADRPAGTPESVAFLGRLSLQEVYALYARSSIGLNFVPDVSPYRHQDSTKLIEYNAAGMGTLTTSYRWAQTFEYARGGRFLKWREDLTAEHILGFDYGVADVDDLAWESVLARSGIVRAIDTLLKSDGVRRD